MRRVFVSVLVLAMTIGPSAAAPAQTEAASVLLIMDASGSMNRVDDTGTRLIDGAKGALREIVQRLPPDANVGLRVYGHRTSNDDPVAGCVDTELVVPVGPIDRGALNAAIDSFDASGFTPIGLSLQEAANDLPESGARTIILVSDGVDTCAPPDPCEVAQQLAAEGFVTQIHTVGFFLNDQAAANQLQCIADAGHGTFTSVDSIDHFFEQLSGLVTGALEGPERIQLNVQGALLRDLAPVVPWARHNPDWPALETDAVGTIEAGETRWFAFDVSLDLVPYGQLFASASVEWQTDAGPDEYLEIQIYNEQGEPLGQPHEVLDIVVESPQRLYLARAAEYTPTDSMPNVAAATGPRGMFPAWEGDEAWFAPTKERFYDAGLNGGMYQLWKRVEKDPPLPEGRYYVAVTWSSDRNATSGLGLYAVVYPGEGQGWNEDRLVPDAWILDLAVATDFDPLLLDPTDWDGSEVALGLPRRSVEVWAVLKAGQPREYQLHLDEGERLFIGSQTLFAEWQSEGYQGRVDFDLAYEWGSGINEMEIEVDHMGYAERNVWEVPLSGKYTLTATLPLHDPWTDPAVVLAFFVFPPDDTPPGGLPDSVIDDTPWGGLPQSVVDALMAGLTAVRQTAG